MSELSEIVEKSLLAKSIVDHLLISPEHKILIDGDSTGTRSEGLLFVVGVKSLEAHDKEAVLKIFKELHENEEIFFPQKKEDDYQEYKKYSSHNQKDKNTLSYFEKVIPGQDLRALQVSMFLRVKALRGRNIYGDKNDIRLWFGKRGAHIANLCSAGYFENEFMQMHKTETTEDFNTYYELAVGQEARALFVHTQMSSKELYKEVNRIVSLNIKHGLDGFTIHGKGGNNIATIKKYVAFFEKEQKEKGEETEIFRLVKILDNPKLEIIQYDVEILNRH